MTSVPKPAYYKPTSYHQEYQRGNIDYTNDYRGTNTVYKLGSHSSTVDNKNHIGGPVTHQQGHNNFGGSSCIGACLILLI